LAVAAYFAACQRWPKAKISCGRAREWRRRIGFGGLLEPSTLTVAVKQAEVPHGDCCRLYRRAEPFSVVSSFFLAARALNSP
jgi:hypothetical protein